MKPQSQLFRLFSRVGASTRNTRTRRVRNLAAWFEPVEDRCLPSGLTTLASFQGSNGQGPVALVADSQGNLFGATGHGGTGDNGVVFQIAGGSSVINVIATFSAATGTHPADLVIDSNGNLFGVCGAGGTNNDGTVFEVAAGSNTVTTLASFNGTNGSSPHNLILDAQGNLFGTTTSGGANSVGTIFEVAAGSGTVTALASFSTTTGNLCSGLVEDSQGNLFGANSFGSAGRYGAVFELPAGSSTITTLATFSYSAGSTLGLDPSSPLVMDASGNLFGTTTSDSASGFGTIYKLAHGSNTITTIANLNGSNGSGPSGRLARDSSGNIFGTTTGSSTAGVKGVLFELNASSGTITGLGNFTDLGPQGVSVEDKFGNLYGLTTGGGSGFAGTVFEYQPAPTVPAPTVTGVSPASGPTAGGTAVTITGTNLANATEVDFGSAKVTSFTTDTANSITLKTPPGAAGTVDVRVFTAGGGSAVNAPADRFTFVAPAAPTVTGVSPAIGLIAGGDAVTITGTNLANATEVDFGSTKVTSFTSDTATSIILNTPPGAVGVVDVRVVTPIAESAANAADQFAYVTLPAPLITGVSQSNLSITSSGDLTATITLSGLALPAGAEVVVDGKVWPTTVQTGTNGQRQLVATNASDPGSLQLNGIDDFVQLFDTVSGTKSDSVSVSPLPTGNDLQPSITSVTTNPPTPLAGTTFTVTVHGTNFGTRSDAAFVNFVHDVDVKPSHYDPQTGTLSFDATAHMAMVVRVGVHNLGSLHAKPFPLQILDPKPTITGLAPATAPTSSLLSEIVTGSNFLQGGQAYFKPPGADDFEPRPTEFIDAQHVKVTFLSSDVSGILLSGNLQFNNPIDEDVDVVTGLSDSFPVNVGTPVPQITSLSPAGASVGVSAFTLTISGSNFVPGATVAWNDTPLANPAVTANLITVHVPADLLTSVGIARITVINSTPVGSQTSKAAIFAIGDSLGGLSVSPTSATAFSSGLTITINGSGFLRPDGGSGPSPVVNWNGAALDTAFVSSTQLSATVPANLLTTAGTIGISVTNPLAGGGSQLLGPITLTVYNPSPVIVVDDTTTGTATYGQDFTLHVTGVPTFGANLAFLKGAVVLLNGQTYPTTYIDPTHLTADIPAAALPVPTSAKSDVSFTLENPGPSLGPSNPGQFPVQVPQPNATSVGPKLIVADGVSSDVTLSVVGTNFVPGVTQAELVDVAADATFPLSTTVVGDTYLTAVLPADFLQSGYSYSVVVANYGLKSDPSKAPALDIDNPVPEIDGITPTFAPSVTAADAKVDPGPYVQVTIVGQNFSPQYTSLEIDDATDNPIPFYVQASTITATQITATLNMQGVPAGYATLTVTNSGPGGGPSNPVTFTVIDPAPQIYDINDRVPSPPAVYAGGPAFTLTVPGNNLLPGATLLWNGQPLPTTVLSASKLSAQVPAANIASPGTATLGLVNGDGEVATNTITYQIQKTFNVVSSLSPASVTPGAPSLQMTVNGNYFLNGDIVQWQSSAQSAPVSLATTYVSGQQLIATVPASLMATPTTALVTVLDPAVGPENAASSAVMYVVYPPPTISSLSPASIPAGSLPSQQFIDLTISGAGFRNDDSIWISPSNDPTNYFPQVFKFDSSSKIETFLYGSYFATTGNVSIYVKHAVNNGHSTIATLTVRPADSGGEFAFKTGTYAVSETAANVTITVVRTGSAAKSATVKYATSNGTATAGTNYTAASGTLSFAAGVTSKTFTVAIRNDNLYAATKTFNITLGSPTNGAGIGAIGTSVVSVQNVTPPPQISFKQATASGPITQQANLVVVLSAKSGLPATAAYTVSGTAIAGVDYTLPTTHVVTIAAGLTSAVIPVKILNNGTVHANRTLTLTLTSPSGTALGKVHAETYTIIDTNKLPTISFQKATGSGPMTSNAKLVVVLSRASTVATTVNFAITGGTAVAGTDYKAPTIKTLTFAPGQTSAVIPITILKNTKAQKSRTLVVTLSKPSKATLGSTVVETYTITTK